MMHQLAEGRATGPAALTTAASQELPFISVLVPVRNESAFIAATLGQLFEQDYPAERYEILVADGESTDETPGIVARLAEGRPNVRLLRNPKRLSSAARNVAARAARGDLLLLIDGHCEINNRRYLREVAAAFARSGADCVGRPQPLDVTGASRLQRAIAAARASRLGHHPASHIYSDREGLVPPQSVAVAYRRSVFERVGYFDERFDACEDYELNHRVAKAGLTCYFSPRVAVRYHPRDSLSRLFYQMVRYGRGRVRMLRKHPDTLSLPSLVPAAFVAGLAAGPLLALLWSPLWLVYLGALAVYAGLLLLGSLAVALGENDLAMLPLLPVVFATVHLGAGWGAWREVVGKAPPHPPGPPLPQGERGEQEGRPSVLRLPSAVATLAPSPLVGVGGQGGEGVALLNALTIDVEDYYHVSGFEHIIDRDDWDRFPSRVAVSTDRLLDVLAAANVRGTFFILGWVAERQPSLVRAIRSAGHEVGCHSYAHRLIYTQTPAEFRADLRRGMRILEDVLGEPVTSYRAPSFSITAKSLWALDILIEEGITLDSSIYPTHHDRYGIAGTPLGPHRIERPAGGLWEFPPPVCRMMGYPLPVGGGGYFRLFPYWLTRRGLKRINAEGRPFSTYLHPWELDPDQPRLTPGRARAFRHYVNLRQTEPRLEQLLRDFRFGTLTEALAQLAPDAARTERPAARRAA